MRKKLILIITLALVAVLTLAVFLVASAVSGANFTTFNAHVDGAGKDVCKNTAINCNIYGDKRYVWLNGGPTANDLGPDGEYFFTVLEPGGQPNPIACLFFWVISDLSYLLKLIDSLPQSEIFYHPFVR